MLTNKTKYILQHGFSVTQILQVLTSYSGIQKFKFLYRNLKGLTFPYALQNQENERNRIVTKLSQSHFLKDKVEELAAALFPNLTGKVIESNISPAKSPSPRHKI